MKEKSENKIQGNSNKIFDGYIGKIIEFFVVFIVNLSFFITINFFRDKIPFITEDITRWLFFADLSIFISILSGLLLIFLRGDIYRMPLYIIQDIASLFSTAALYIIYPFNFKDPVWIDWLRNLNETNRLDERFLSVNIDFWVKFSLICVMLAICIGIIVKAIKFAIALIKSVSK